MSYLDKVSVGGTTYDVRDTVILGANAGLTTDQQGYARTNFGAAGEVETELFPSTPGYLYQQNFSTAIVVAMDSETGLPVMAESPENASSKYRYSLIDVSGQVGDYYRFDCIAGGAASPCPVILSADGTIMARHYSSGTRLQDAWQIPRGAKWLYFVANIGTGNTFIDNRFWHLPYSAWANSLQANTAVEGMIENLSIIQTVPIEWGQGYISQSGSTTSSDYYIRTSNYPRITQDCVLRIVPGQNCAYALRFYEYDNPTSAGLTGFWPQWLATEKALIPLSGPQRFRMIICHKDGTAITPEEAANTTVEILTAMPQAPTEDGSYSLKCAVASGAATYSWEADAT